MLKDATQPKSGAKVFREGLESQWRELKVVLFKLPPWFRLSQFLTAVGAEERLSTILQRRMWPSVKDREGGKGHRGKGKSSYSELAQPEVLESLSLLWFEVLDPVDRALLEEYAGVHND